MSRRKLRRWSALFIKHARCLAMSLDSLYQEVILEHYKNPHNYGSLPGARLIHQENPSCGDQIDLQLIIGDDQRIQAIKFTGQGCAISRASASMMTEVVE